MGVRLSTAKAVVEPAARMLVRRSMRIPIVKPRSIACFFDSGLSRPVRDLISESKRRRRGHRCRPSPSDQEGAGSCARFSLQ